MNNKLEKRVNNIRGSLNTLSISSFNDPLAKKVNWDSIKTFECGFREQQAKLINSNKLVFRATLGAMLFYLIFVIAGFGAIFGTIYKIIISNVFTLNVDMIMIPLIGLIFLSIGGFMFYKVTKPLIFCKNTSLLWKEKKLPKSEDIIHLKQIHALQIIAKYCRNRDKSIHGYELNLILKNTERVNIASHTNIEALRKDADILADFLGIYIWDVTNSNNNL